MQFVEAPIIEFARRVFEEYNYDMSHGMLHARAAVNNAQEIVKKMPARFSQGDLIVIYNAAFVHDVVDEKYVTNKDVGVRLESKLAECYSEEAAASIMKIINNTSFSKRVARIKKGLAGIDMGPLQLHTEIVSDADMLCAFDPVMCAVYNSHHYPGNEESKCKKITNIMKDRILLYRDEYMNTEAGRTLAAARHDLLLQWWGMYGENYRLP